MVMYHNCGGPRMASYIDSVSFTIFGDIPKQQLLEFDRQGGAASLAAGPSPGSATACPLARVIGASLVGKALFTPRKPLSSVIDPEAKPGGLGNRYPVDREDFREIQHPWSPERELDDGAVPKRTSKTRTGQGFWALSFCFAIEELRSQPASSAGSIQARANGRRLRSKYWLDVSRSRPDCAAKDSGELMAVSALCSFISLTRTRRGKPG